MAKRDTGLLIEEIFYCGTKGLQIDKIKFSEINLQRNYNST